MKMSVLCPKTSAKRRFPGSIRLIECLERADVTFSKRPHFSDGNPVVELEGTATNPITPDLVAQERQI
jgi:hypothetical protein